MKGVEFLAVEGKKSRVKGPLLSLQNSAFPLSLRRYVYLTAAISGGAIMIVQILGAKMLAPYVGTSHFVWTAQIAVTLVALAFGYYLGGRQADRARRLSWLYGVLLVTAIYLSGIILVLRPIATWCLDFPLALGSLMASALLFFVPLSLMAMTSPFLVRFLTGSVATVGGSMGRLTAVSTMGSFVGTLLIGYALIPYLPNSVTLLLTAGLLAGISAVYFLFWGRQRANWPALAVALIAGLALAAAGLRVDRRQTVGDFKELFRANSNFGLIQVLENQEGMRFYLTDLLVQNTYDPQAAAGMSAFTYMLHGLARGYTPKIQSALCIGLGIGLVPAQFAREGVDVDVVEINPRAAAVAAEFFDCPVDTFHLTIGDGRQFINRTTNHYDTIILDAFLGDSSPGHLMSREAFDAMRQRLRPDGTLVINCFADFRPGRDFYGASLDKTLRHVFRSVRLHATGSGNVYFVASDRNPLDLLRTPDFAEVPHARLRQEVQRAFGATMRANPDQGRVLRDDYNPVEVFDALNRETIRRELARSMAL
jgi:spermidine synthase